MTGTLALLAALVVAAVLGLLLRVRDGRVRISRRPPAVTGAEGGPGVHLPPEVRELVAGPPGQRESVTLLQLSTTFCAPCRHTRALLASVVEVTPGLRHVEFDLTDTPEVAARLGVLRTPTTIAYDVTGAELLRIGGVPRRDALLDALQSHLP